MQEDIYLSILGVDLAWVGHNGTEGLMANIRLACNFHDKISISELIMQGAQNRQDLEMD